MNSITTNNPVSVLIVEDESIIAMEIEVELQSRGFNVIGTVLSSEDAIDVAATRRPDVILMDIHIQGSKDGIQSSMEILNTYRPIIIFVSAYGDDIKHKIGAVRQHLFLLKPFSCSELITMIDESVSSRRTASDDHADAIDAG